MKSPGQEIYKLCNIPHVSFRIHDTDKQHIWHMIDRHIVEIQGFLH